MEELEKNETSTQAEENTVSLASAQALADALAKIEAYTPTTWVDNSSPDIDAEHLNKPEQAIKRVTDALNSAVDVIKDLQSQVTKNAGAISDVNNNLSNTNSRLDTSLSSSVLDYALTLPEGMHTVRFPGDGYTGADTPNSHYRYSSATIIVRSKGKIVTVLLYGISTKAPLAVNSYDGGKWNGWDQYVTKNDFVIKTYTIAGKAVNAETIADFEPNIALSGYTPLGIVGTRLNAYGSVTLVYADLVDDTKARVRVRNNGTESVTGDNVIIRVLYFKS